MKTFQVRIAKEGKHRCLKFKSELPMESVLDAVKAVVKNTYHVSIKEINWKVPEDRDIMWAINEAANVRFHHKVWKETVQEVLVPTVEFVGQIVMPSGTKVYCNVNTNTFFDFCLPTSWYIKPDIPKINALAGLDIRTSENGMHPFYLRGKYKIECNECTKGTLVTFYKIFTKNVVTGEFVTEEI